MNPKSKRKRKIKQELIKWVEVSPFIIIGIILLLAFPIVPLLTFFGTIFLYLFEFGKTSFDFMAKKIKSPVLTKKAVFLIFVALVSEAGFVFWAFLSIGFWEKFKIFSTPDGIVIFTFWLLVFDVFSPDGKLVT